MLSLVCDEVGEQLLGDLLRYGPIWMKGSYMDGTARSPARLDA